MSALQNNQFLLASGSPTDPTFPVQRSVRLRSSASAYFNRTPASAGSRTTWTFSAWVKRGLSGQRPLLQAGTVGNTYTLIQFRSTNELVLTQNDASANTAVIISTNLFRDYSAWYHIVAVWNTTSATSTDRLQLWVNGVRITSFSSSLFPAQNTNSHINNNIANDIGKYDTIYQDGYLTEVNFIDGQALTPSSFGGYNSGTGVWEPRKYTGTYGTNGFYLPFTDNTLGTLLSNSGNISAPYGGTATNALAADGVYCTSNVSVGSTFTFLLNTFATATQVTRYSITNLSFTGGASTFSIQSSPDNSTWTTLATLSVTASNQNFSGSLNGYARYFRIAPTSFGTNGSASVDAFLLYADGLGLDFSGNGNNWTPNNISVTAGVTYDSMLDVPTNTSPTNANFPTLNPLNGNNIGVGNLQVTGTATGGENHYSTIALPTTGKWYCEMSSTAYNASTIVGWFGVSNTSGTNFSGLLSRVSGAGAGFFQNDTLISSTNIGALNTIFGLAVDRGANTITIYLNNVAQGTVPTLATGVDLFFYYGSYTSGTGWVNFGQRPFTYTPPTGFKALNTYNLPTPTIANGATQFAATTYTGNGSTQSITNTVNGKSFKPDFVWMKSRGQAYSNVLADSVRGVGKVLYSNAINAEDTGAYLTAFNSNGFSVNVTPGVAVNQNADPLIAWQWKASNATAVTNTSGSISSQVSANPTAGFSIVTYTGNGSNPATVGHGIGIAPKFIILKRRNSAVNWFVYANAVGNGVIEGLNTTNAYNAGSTIFNLTAPTSTVFSLGNVDGNASGGTYVAYCFAPIAGYSAFGSYTGNASTDGAFIYTGFRPRFILIKNITTAGYNWMIMDTSRLGYNVNNYTLSPNLAGVEQGYTPLDILSNGFKIRTTDGHWNLSGNTYIYAAFAESPFNYSLAR